MKKWIAALAVLVVITASCGNPVGKVIREYGLSSKDYDPEVKPYAVFDFDNTTIEGDISLASLVYLIENLDFRMPPESLYPAFLNCVPDKDRALEGFAGVSARMLATDIYSDYTWLYDNYISSHKLSLEQVHESEQFKDFRTKLWALSLGVDNTFGSAEVGCLWILRPFSGMTEDDLKELVNAAVADELKVKISQEKWTSPDVGEAGEVSVDVPRGMRIGKGMLKLYKTLQKKGFDVYICSASSEAMVEALACDEEYFNLPEDHVFGIRISSGKVISPNATYLPGYPVTYAEGKVELIKSLIMPSHSDCDPAITGGDSNGDYPMLTSFPAMRLGIIIDFPRSGEIALLKKEGGRKYYVTSYKKVF